MLITGQGDIMKNKKNVLYILVIFFTFIMPIIPSTFKIKSIFLNGDVVLYLIVVYFLIIFIFDKKVRNSILLNYKSAFKDPLNVFMVIWSITMFVSIIYSRDKLLASAESIRLTSYVFLFFILKYFIYEEKIYEYILKSYMSASFVIGVYGIYQNIIGRGIVQNSLFGTEIRVYSFMENPNNLGMYFVFTFFPFIVLLIKDKKRENKIVYLVLTIISLANIVFSGSRNALIGFTIGIFMVIVLLGIKYIYLFILPVLIYFIPTVSTRVKDISDTTQNLSRIVIWQLAGLIIKDHPILGVGNGNYPKNLTDYKNVINKIDYDFANLVHPHNAFLKAYCELGLLGLISFTGLIISSFFAVYKFIKNRSDDFYNWFYTGVLVSLFSMVSMNLLDSFFSSPKVIVYYFIVLGVCEGIRFRGYEDIMVNQNR